MHLTSHGLPGSLCVSHTLWPYRCIVPAAAWAPGGLTTFSCGAGSEGGGEKLSPGRWQMAADLHLAGLVLLELYCAWVHPLVDPQQALPFLPLMLVSTYCAVGMCAGFVFMHWPLTAQLTPPRLKGD